MDVEAFHIPIERNSVEVDPDIIEQTSSKSTENIPEDDYKEVYRTGKTDVIRDNIDSQRGKKWMRVHMCCNITLLILTITGQVMLNKHCTKRLYTWTFAFLGLSSSVIGIYFFWDLQRLTHPRSVYMTMRWLNVLYYISVCLGPFLLLIILSAEPKVWVGSRAGTRITKSILYSILGIMSIELMVCFSLLTGLHCYKKCNVFSCCGPCCIYEAPGVVNPPSQEKWIKFSDVEMTVNGKTNEGVHGSSLEQIVGYVNVGYMC